jgi:caa(3)-type oxidase subunit IV
VANATKGQSPHDGAHGDTHAGEHAHGAGRYWGVWALLICGTIGTVITGRIDLGAGNILVALLIASVKASLVVLFFMHMTEAPAANRIVFVTSVVFAIVLIIGVFGDLWTRNEMTLPSVAPSTLGPEFEVPMAATKPQGQPPGHE